MPSDCQFLANCLAKSTLHNLELLYAIMSQYLLDESGDSVDADMLSKVIFANLKGKEFH